MKYQDKKTGAVVLCDCLLSGDWVLVEGEKSPPASPAPEQTVADLRAKLDSLGIAYNPKAKKSELLALLESSGV